MITLSLLALLIYILKQRFFQFFIKQRKNTVLFIKKLEKPDAGIERNIRKKPKPEWVKQKIVRLKAFMANDGCRKIADTFNRLYADKRNMTVGKSYVYEAIKQHRYDIQVLRKKIKNRKPKLQPKNLIWSMDLTQVRDNRNQLHTIFGILDSGTRACLQLKKIRDKASITLLRAICDCIEKYGSSKVVRTDNEAVFTSKLFRAGLWILGIRHQRTEVCCPWQNGRIERFFGTFKSAAQRLSFSSDSLAERLLEFRFYYNHVRTHQNLNGRTPAEVWSGIKPNSRKGREIVLWNGLLTGIYLPPT